MKLSSAELARLSELADGRAGNRPRAVAGEPGSRALPLSYAALLAQRRKVLGLGDD